MKDEKGRPYIKTTGKQKVLVSIIAVIVILLSIGALIGRIDMNVVLPINCILLGCIQLFNGFTLVSNDSKKLGYFCFIAGIFLLVIGVFTVFQTYYL